jgi:effector-binding domain-containing protein
MMTKAIVLLRRKNPMLSDELRKLRAKICDFAVQTKQQSSGGIVSSTVTTTVLKDWGPNTRHEIHIVCRSEITDNIEIWVLDVGHVRKNWVVKIRRKRADHLVTSRADLKRKADDSVEEGETW